MFKNNTFRFLQPCPFQQQHLHPNTAAFLIMLVSHPSLPLPPSSSPSLSIPLCLSLTSCWHTDQIGTALPPASSLPLLPPPLSPRRSPHQTLTERCHTNSAPPSCSNCFLIFRARTAMPAISLSVLASILSLAGSRRLFPSPLLSPPPPPPTPSPPCYHRPSYSDEPQTVWGYPPN